MITEKSILNLVDEAQNNFISSRFEDAARLFGTTVRNLDQHEYDIDAIYFTYARVVAFEKAKLIEPQIQTLIDLSNRCLNFALKCALEGQKQVEKPHEKSTFMYYAQKIMEPLGRLEERESILISLVKLYQSLIEHSDTTVDMAEMFQERIIEFSNEYDHPEFDTKTEKLKLAKLLVKHADELSQSNKFHVDVMAANKYIRAASIYLEFTMKKEMYELLEVALKCSKHGQFEKYGFVKIERPPIAKDEKGKEIDPDPDMSEDKIKEYLKILIEAIEE